MVLYDHKAPFLLFSHIYTKYPVYVHDAIAGQPRPLKTVSYSTTYTNTSTLSCCNSLYSLEVSSIQGDAS